MLDASEVYRESFREGILPDPALTVSQWSDENRILSQKAAAEPGKWRTERTPYLRDIMDDLSPSSPIQEVVFMKGAQVGGSEAGNNWIGAVIDCFPGPMMIVQPTLTLVKRFSKQRIAPMIEETPVLKKKIKDSRSRDSGNTVEMKEFDGGMLVMAGANSAVGLRSMPVRYLFLDEIDAYPIDLDEEGDPVQLAEKRTTTFARKKIFKVSTPKIKDISRVERSYLSSDQRRYFVPCPHCGNMDWIRWSNIIWTDENPETAMLKCDSCGCLIEERHKTQMLADGEWRATAAGKKLCHGYHLSSLYSPLGWKSWSQVVEEFLTAKTDPVLLKEWTNTVLGETWEDDFAVKVAADSIRSRCETYDALFAPLGVLCVTAGVDVQDNRLAVVIRGWGRDEESWLLYHTEIYGDPAQNEVWKQLDDIIFTPIKHEIGIQIPISVTAIDSGGHFTNEVYNYVRERRNRHVIAIKGSSQRNKPALSRPAKVDLNYRGKTLKQSVEVWAVGTDTIKSVIYARLKLKEKGKGYYHFYETATNEYFEQLTAEKQVTKYIRGYPIREWVKKATARNEALDCEVYSYAALNHIFMRFNRKTIWDQLEKRIKAPELALDQPPPEPEEPVDDQAQDDESPVEIAAQNLPLRKAKNSTSVIPQRGSFVTNY